MTYWQAEAKQIDHKYQVKRKIETRYLFYRSSDFIEFYSPLRGLRATQQRSALDNHEGHSSWSLFQLLFLLPLVDPFPCGGGIVPLQTSRGTPQSLGCSPATPSRLGPKSQRVTNANYEIDKMHKCSSGWIALFFNFTQPTIWLGKFDQSLTKRGWRVFSRLKNVYEC